MFELIFPTVRDLLVTHNKYIVLAYSGNSLIVAPKLFTPKPTSQEANCKVTKTLRAHDDCTVFSTQKNLLRISSVFLKGNEPEKSLISDYLKVLGVA